MGLPRRSFTTRSPVPSIPTTRSTPTTACRHARSPRPRPAQHVESHLPEHRADLRHRSRSSWQERADKMGDEVGRYVRATFDADDVLSQLRTVQAVVTHLET